METNITTVTQMNSDRKRYSIAAERLSGYTRQHRHSMLQLAKFKTSSTCNSVMSAAYSKNIENVSFFTWKKLEFRNKTLGCWMTLSASFDSRVRFFQRDSIHTCAFDPFGSRGK